MIQTPLNICLYVHIFERRLIFLQYLIILSSFSHVTFDAVPNPVKRTLSHFTVKEAMAQRPIGGPRKKTFLPAFLPVPKVN